MRDIPGYEGLYAITPDGRVWCHPREWSAANNARMRHNGKWKKCSLARGYVRVRLDKNAKGKNFAVHRLVAQAYVSNPNDHTEVNHIDGNKQNNIYTNLEWCSREDNMQHAATLGLLSPRFNKPLGD